MDFTFDHDDLDAALRRCGSSWNAAQAHGLLCSRLAFAGADGAAQWLSQVLADTDPNDPFRAECEISLETLATATWRQLAGRQSEFLVLMPDDEEPAPVRAEALGQWCEGFLHGLVAEKHGTEMRARLAADPLAQIIKDLVEITRATADDEEEDEEAWTELVEYLRVAAQLIYEELADFRNPAESGPQFASATLH